MWLLNRSPFLLLVPSPLILWTLDPHLPHYVSRFLCLLFPFTGILSTFVCPRLTSMCPSAVTIPQLPRPLLDLSFMWLPSSPACSPFCWRWPSDLVIHSVRETDQVILAIASKSRRLSDRVNIGPWITRMQVNGHHPFLGILRLCTRLYGLTKSHGLVPKRV